MDDCTISYNLRLITITIILYFTSDVQRPGCDKIIDMNRRGFTIVELLIVIVVVAILAAVTLTAFRGAQERAYRNRAIGEASALAKATQVFHTINERYPADVERNVPAEIAPYISGDSSNWPYAPWPNSVYDYDYFVGSDGNEVAQISIRFCPIGGPSQLADSLTNLGRRAFKSTVAPIGV